MSEIQDLNNFADKKAYEIAYAIFRIASASRSNSLAGSLEVEAMRLLGAVTGRDYRGAERSLAPMGYFLKLGMDLNLINPKNYELLYAEIKNLEAVISRLTEPVAEEISLSDIFTPSFRANAERREFSSISDNGVNVENSYAAVSSVVDGAERDIDDDFDHDLRSGEFAGLQDNNAASGEESGNGESNGILKAASRQSTIVERIRQNGNCRLKELQDVLPDVSERTIRYDLQALLEQNAIERFGGGGPATYYRIRV